MSENISLPKIFLQRENIQHILVIKLRHFGDVLLTTPLFRTLKINYPNALIDALVYEGTEAMLACNKDINNIYTIDRSLKKQGIKAQVTGEYNLFKKLSHVHYDLILNLSDHMRTAVYCRLLKPTFSIAFCHPKHNNWLWKSAHSILLPTESYYEEHVVPYTLSILSPLALPEVSTKVTMAYCQQDLQCFEKIKQQYTLKDYILIQPTARWAFKTWSAKSFSELINYLTQKGFKVVLTAGKAEEELALVEKIIAGCHDHAMLVNLAGNLSLTQLAAMIDHAKLFIGVDSAPMHMAAALQTPMVVLFGPTNLKQWYPWQVKHKLIWAGSYRELPHFLQINTDTDERYLDAIPVQDVIKAVAEQLTANLK